MPRQPFDKSQLVHPDDLELACTTKLVKYKQPRTPAVLKKREADKQRWREKYGPQGTYREYKRAYMHWYRKTPHNIAWRKEYDRKRRLAKKEANAKAS